MNDNQPDPLAGLDEKQRAEFMAAVEQMAEARKTAPPAAAAVPENTGNTASGKDVDWSQYDIPFNLRHLYVQATHRETERGPKWVVMIDEFRSTERSFRQFGKKVDSPFRDRSGEVIEEWHNLGQYLSEILNSDEGWQLAAAMPGSSGQCGVLLRRSNPTILPDPVLLKKDTDVAVPSDEELARVNAAGLDFAASEGGTSDGENAPATLTHLEQQAVELNAPARYPLPLGMNAGAEEGTVAHEARAIGTEVAGAVERGMLPEVPSTLSEEDSR